MAVGWGTVMVGQLAVKLFESLASFGCTAEGGLRKKVSRTSLVKRRFGFWKEGAQEEGGTGGVGGWSMSGRQFCRRESMCQPGWENSEPRAVDSAIPAGPPKPEGRDGAYLGWISQQLEEG